MFCGASNIGDPANVALEIQEEAGLENSTLPLVFTSASGCINLDFFVCLI